MSIKQRLRAGERLRGGLLRIPADFLVELAGVAGLDFVLIDCEHGPADLITVQQHIVAAQAHGLGVLVRVGRAEPDFVLRVLDIGAEGIVVPHVDTPEDARRAVRAAHYPPRGDRGFATYSRAGSFGAVSIAAHLANAADTTLVVPMLETAGACAAAADIAAVDGVDALLVGPADLSVSMGYSEGPAEPAVQAMLDKVVAAAEVAGRPMFHIVGTAEQARSLPAGAVVFNLAHVLLGTFRSLADS
ncbi:4-hydroxy-2-oxoheptanedioate aldolase [Tamaricihabitans halophyticus]|uniref:4-hydroxy-2-oxoheptanedioate aldolase n=1 Tax=Tamaricihabitans halophyticus TaxID=1262583 RepID=A0A4V2SS43_9PSEU|nr:aldolase/citrate lyase family protein [Tamaricihabitans halophyticus]TCP45096.1 4-hydroxy-2-oxoheptanedioate aldolase [Tamaricihabitans halophyticus]